MTKLERAGMECLVFGMDVESRDIVLNFCMFKGFGKAVPFSMDGVQSKLLYVGGAPTGVSSKWETLMTTTQKFLHSYISKQVKDYELCLT